MKRSERHGCDGVPDQPNPFLPAQAPPGFAESGARVRSPAADRRPAQLLGTTPCVPPDRPLPYGHLGEAEHETFC